jgi:hypothetical protein
VGVGETSRVADAVVEWSGVSVLVGEKWPSVTFVLDLVELATDEYEGVDDDEAVRVLEGSGDSVWVYVPMRSDTVRVWSSLGERERRVIEGMSVIVLGDWDSDDVADGVATSVRDAEGGIDRDLVKVGSSVRDTDSELETNNEGDTDGVSTKVALAVRIRDAVGEGASEYVFQRLQMHPVPVLSAPSFHWDCCDANAYTIMPLKGWPGTQLQYVAHDPPLNASFPV